MSDPAPTTDRPQPPPVKLAFISHSSRDAAVAMQIVAALEAAGVKCWIAPRDIPAGGDYNEQIITGIIASDALLLIYSRHSVDSDPVKREVERARNRKVPVIPLRLENVPPSKSMEFLIAMSQWVDAFPPPVDRHLETITAAVKQTLELEHASPKRDPNAPPKYVSHYRILEKLGEGGMGTVYKAEQRTPVKRTVALKLIKLGMGTKEVLARFEAERQALARMNHPNIARVLDADADEIGRPYFVMEYVNGKPITVFADEYKLSIKDRLKLFIQVCDAIAHAHTKSLLHRDIKAPNVLASMEDGKPTVKVIDFGIAKALSGDKLTDRTLYTEFGLAVGSYESMSPEQAEGSPDIDTRTDVYSLGALLYELLTGAKPFDTSAMTRATDAETKRIIREVNPPKPSMRLSALTAAQGTTIAEARVSQIDSLRRELQSELEWIPLMAMRKERNRRYSSPGELAEDIQNYLDDRPLRAGPESAAYRLRKMFSRNRAAVFTAAAFLCVVSFGVATYIHDIRIEQSRTASALAEAVKQKAQALSASAAAEKATAQALADKTEADILRAKAEQQGYFAAISAASTAIEQNQAGVARQWLDGTAPSQRRWEWGYLRSESDLSLAVLAPAVLPDRQNVQKVTSAAFSPDGMRILTASFDKTAIIRNVDSIGSPGSWIVLHVRGNESEFESAAFSPDGTRVVTAELDGAVRVWDAASGRQLALLSGHTGPVVSAVFSPDGTRIVTASHDKSARVWDAASGRQLALLQAHSDANFGPETDEVNSARFSPDGKRVVTAAWDSTVRIWDAASGKELAVLRGHANPVNYADFSPDGKRVLTASNDGTARIWDTASGKQLVLLKGHEAEVVSASFSPNGARVVTASFDATARIWDTASGRELTVLRGHQSGVRTAAFSPDGTRVVTASTDRTARVWDPASGRQQALLRGHDDAVRSALFSPDGSRVVTASADGTARVWDVKDPESVVQDALNDHTWATGLSADGTMAIRARENADPQLWDVTTGQQVAFPGTNLGRPAGGVLSDDGMRLFAAYADKSARIWDVSTGEQLAVLPGYIPTFAAFSPDATRVLTASNDKTGRIWDVASASQVAALADADPAFAAFSPDGTRVATASQDRQAQIWDTTTGRRLASLDEGGIATVAFSKDGTRLVTASADGTARVWDATSGRQLTSFSGSQHQPLYSAAFSPDAMRVVTASADKTACVWDAASGSELAVLRGHDRQVISAAFSPDGTRVLTISLDGTARVWDAALGRELRVLRAYGGSVALRFDPFGGISHAVFSRDGSRIVTASDRGVIRIWDSVSAAERFKATGQPLVPRFEPTTRPPPRG